MCDPDRLARRIAFLFVALVTDVSIAQNLIANGSFESGTTDWLLIGGGVECGNWWKAADGEYSVDLNSCTAGGLAQAFATLAGTDYCVTFALAGNPDGPPAVKMMRVQAGNFSQVFEFDVTDTSAFAMGWQVKTWHFTATDAITTLELISLTDGCYGPAVDDVRVASSYLFSALASPRSRLIL